MAKYINNSKFANWSKTNSCTPRYYDKPKTLFEIRKAIEFCKLNNVKMRICGSVTSPSDITMTDEFLLDTRGLDKIVSVDTTTSKSVLQSGVLLKDFVKTLSEKYFAAFPTLPSIMEQTIGGLLSTSSHGTGYAISSFSRYVSKMRIVDSNGELKVLRKDTDLFYAASTGLGLFGVIFDIELDIEKLFYLKSKQKSVGTDFFYKNMIELAEKNEYFRAWTIPHINKTVIWEAEKIQYRSDLGDIRKFETQKWWEKIFKFDKIFRKLFEASLFVGKYFPFFVPIINKICFYFLFYREQTKLDFYQNQLTFDCLFSQHVTEWAVSVNKASFVLKELLQIVEKRNWKVHFPIEVRFCAKEPSFLSPAHEEDVCYIGIIMYRPFGANIDHEEYFDCFQRIMMKNGGRPHWSKTYDLNEEYFRKVYPRWDEWKKHKKTMDPHALFENNWARRIFERH